MSKTPPKPAQDPSRLIDKEAMFKKIMPSATRQPASQPGLPTTRRQTAAVPRLPVIAAAPAAPTAPVAPPPLLDRTENTALFADDLFAEDFDFGDLGAEVIAPEAPVHPSTVSQEPDLANDPSPAEMFYGEPPQAPDSSALYNQDDLVPYESTMPNQQATPYPIQPPQQQPMQQQMPIQSVQPAPVAASEPTWSEDALVAVNLMEQIVFQRVDEVIRRVRGCTCEQCRTDLAALSLNKLSPQYMLAGEVREEQFLSRKLVAEAVTAMMQSAFYVKLHPRHGDSL